MGGTARPGVVVGRRARRGSSRWSTMPERDTLGQWARRPQDESALALRRRIADMVGSMMAESPPLGGPGVVLLNGVRV